VVDGRGVTAPFVDTRSYRSRTPRCFRSSSSSTAP
jgi:hypothetical protein